MSQNTNGNDGRQEHANKVVGQGLHQAGDRGNAALEASRNLASKLIVVIAQR